MLYYKTMGMDKNIMYVISFFLGMLIFHLLKDYCGCNNVVEGQGCNFGVDTDCSCANADVTQRIKQTDGGEEDADDEYWACKGGFGEFERPVSCPALAIDSKEPNPEYGNCVRTCAEINECAVNTDPCSYFTETDPGSGKIYQCQDDAAHIGMCKRNDNDVECTDADLANPAPQPPAPPPPATAATDGCCA